MKPPGAAQRRSRAVGKSASLQHLPSHANLLHDVSTAPAPSSRSRRGRTDAIVVPATRPASALAGIIELAAELETQLVILCSRQAKINRVAERVGRVRRARAVVVQIGDEYELPVPGFETSSHDFTAANGGRDSDLSLKRNVGLLLARLRGWRKIVYVDDDITLGKSDIARISHQLDNHQFASMACREFPDNSVFCHARRLAKLHQDVFVSGSVLGVNCSDLPMPFFPDIYNEDWFFVGEAAARRRLVKAGEAHQAPYDPFVEPTRAGGEEFGDLLAEGLYALIENQGAGSSFRQVTHLANERYWSSFIDVRWHDLQDTRARLEAFAGRDSCSDTVTDGIKSLNEALGRYESDQINAERCARFLEAWRGDTSEWARAIARISTLGSTQDAMDWLKIRNWQSVR
jgi:hypothetical protein